MKKTTAKSTKKTTGEKVKKDNPDQSQQFIETAESLGCDKSEREFNKAMRKIKGSPS